MKRILLAISCLIATALVHAQQPNSAKTDTTALTDSILSEELKDNISDNIPTISLDDNEISDAGTQSVSSLLTAGRDPFYNAAAFNFNTARFRVRGYDADLSSVYINGIPMDNLDNGYTPWGLWGGMNDVFKNRDVNYALHYNTFGFGDIGSTTNMDVRAGKQKKQTSFGYALSNRNYTHRMSLTSSTGIFKKGWAFTFSGSRRYANEGYVPGTYYNSWSWFGAADKKFGQKQWLSFIIFGSPTEYGRQGASTKEMMSLAGTQYYNPSWGYQNGKKRSANISKSNQPVIILTHEYRINEKTNLVTSASYLFGNRSLSGIDWYNAADPRPDYYRYMPSYYEANGNTATAASVKSYLQNNEAARQINWDNLYNINRENTASITNANGIEGNTVTGNRSYYILGDRMTNTKRFSFNININSRFSEHVNLTAGLTFQTTRNNYYQRVHDLLGGQFWVNINQFAQRSFPDNNYAYQNDTEHPNRIVQEGEKYGYNYNISIHKPEEWAQLVFTFKRIDFFIAGEVSQTKFWRAGNVRNGLFPDNSFGKSATYIFDNYAVKGGITYKLNGRNYIYANGAVLTRAPYYDNAYISPRTRDFTQDNLRSEMIRTAEAGYVLNAPKVRMRLSGYYTTIQHGFNMLTFYYDEYQDFVNYALSNIDKLYFGGEYGIEAKVARNITANGAAAIGRYYYNSRQQAVITVDNTAEIVDQAMVYSNNYRIAGTPQEAYSTGVTYRSPKFWFVSLTGNYFKQMWIDFNPIRRTYAATDGVSNPDDDKTHAILDQQQLAPQSTVDFFAGYSWRVPHTYISKRPVYLNIYSGINNLLNNKKIITGGYEQLRYDFSASAEQNLLKFSPKYYYSYGLNYFISVQLRF